MKTQYLLQGSVAPDWIVLKKSGMFGQALFSTRFANGKKIVNVASVAIILRWSRAHM
jgi:hypothetical protein